MSIGNLKDQGNKGNNFPYQLRTLQLLGAINDSIAALPGVDHESRTSTYQAINNGVGYSIGDIIIRYDIIDLATGLIDSTIWFNDTLQTQLIPAPLPADLTPVSAPTGVTVLNGPAGASVNIQDGGNSITVDDGGTPLSVQGTVNSNLRDGLGNPISSTGSSLDVNITNAIPLEVNIDQANDSILIYGFDGTNNQPIATSTAGVLQVDILSIPIVDVSGSSISVSNFPAIQDVNILSSVILDVSGSNVLVTGTVSVTQDPLSNPWIVSGTVAATQSGVWNVGVTSIVEVEVKNDTGVPIPVAVQGVVQVNLDAEEDQVGIYGYLNGPAGATGSPIKINVNANGVLAIQDNGGSITIDATSLPLPTGAATEATLATRATETTLTDIKNNVTSKIDRIRNSPDYSRIFTYYPGTNNVKDITHTGTTTLGSATLTETFTYVNNLIDGSNVVSIIYS